MSVLGSGEGWKRVAIGVALFLLLVGGYGIVNDLFSGFGLFHASRSWIAWLAGCVVLGLIWLLAEGVGEWVSSRDHVDDPLPRRVGNLALLLGSALVILVRWVSRLG